MLNACNVCGTISDTTRCPKHGGLEKGDTSWNGKRNRTTQSRFRHAVLTRAGHRCQGLDYGQRCATTAPLEAHHTEPGNNDPSTGLALCGRHHAPTDPYARGPRA